MGVVGESGMMGSGWRVLGVGVVEESEMGSGWRLGESERGVRILGVLGKGVMMRKGLGIGSVRRRSVTVIVGAGSDWRRRWRVSLMPSKFTVRLFSEA